MLTYYTRDIADQLEDKTTEEATRKVLKNKQRLKLPPSLLRMANEKTLVGTLSGAVLMFTLQMARITPDNIFENTLLHKT